MTSAVWRIPSTSTVESEGAGSRLHLADLVHGTGVARIGNDGQPAQIGNELAQYIQPLAGEIGRLDRQPGDVAARPRETRHQAGAERIDRDREDDRDRRGRLPDRVDRAARRHDDIDFQPDELGGKLGETLALSLGPAILDRDGTAHAPAELVQAPHESCVPIVPVRRRTHTQNADGGQLRRLCAQPQRPRGGAADSQQERAAFHSITSSARASRVAGKSRPSALAVLRLITSSYRVGACTGRSAGFSPLRMRST